MRQSIRIIALTSLALSATGCVSTLPSISHVHVGHAFTGWVSTPGQNGLFVTAEKIAGQIARESSEALDLIRRGNLAAATDKATKVADLVGGVDDTIAEPDDYRFLSAFQEARNHLTYSMQSDDASSNMIAGIEKFLADSEIILARADLIQAFAAELEIISDITEAEDLARELRILAVQNLEGEDVDGSGVIGDSADEFGLRQLRDDVSRVLAAENPKYRPVEQRYLFGLVRLPDGTWKFRDSGSSSSYGRYSY